jgi:hypothetical protein
VESVKKKDWSMIDVLVRGMKKGLYEIRKEVWDEVPNREKKLRKILVFASVVLVAAAAFNYYQGYMKYLQNINSNLSLSHFIDSKGVTCLLGVSLVSACLAARIRDSQRV